MPLENGIRVEMKLRIFEFTFSHHNPGRMSVEDRINEISNILAAGFNRLSVSRQNSQNQLADLGPERPHVDTKESPNMEVA